MSTCNDKTTMPTAVWPRFCYYIAWSFLRFFGFNSFFLLLIFTIAFGFELFLFSFVLALGFSAWVWRYLVVLLSWYVLFRVWSFSFFLPSFSSCGPLGKGTMPTQFLLSVYELGGKTYERGWVAGGWRGGLIKLNWLESGYSTGLNCSFSLGIQLKHFLTALITSSSVCVSKSKKTLPKTQDPAHHGHTLTHTHLYPHHITPPHK